MHLRVVGEGQGMYVAVPIILVLADNMSKTGYQQTVISFRLPIGLWVIRRRGRFFDAQKEAYRSKTLFDELRTIVREQAVRDTIRQYPFFDKRHCTFCSGDDVHWYQESHFEVPIGDHHYVICTRTALWEGSQDVHCDIL